MRLARKQDRKSLLSEFEISDLNLAFKIENASAFQLHAIVDQPANDLSATLRRLEGTKLSLTKSPGPIRRQHAMRGPGHRIFRDALGRGEVAADEVLRSISRRAHDHSAAVHACQRRHIGSKCPQDLLALNQCQIVECVPQNFEWNYPQRLRQACRC